MKKFIGVFIAMLLLLSLGLAGCSNSGSKDTASKKGKVEVDFWHAMSGDNGKVLQGIVDDFNKQSKDVYVKAIYQGSYDDALSKLRAVGGSDQAPALVQTFEIGTKYMSTSGFVTPMQKFIDKDKFDTSKLEKNILDYYTIDGKLYSMPFNTSNAVMFYNKDMFKKAGLDPNKPPRTFSEVEGAAKKLTKKGKTHGYTNATIGWFFEELMANQNALYLNNDNGRKGDATKSLVNSDAGLKIFNWLNDMNKAGTFKNYGNQWEDPRGPFFAQQVGMYLDSTANTAEVIKNSPFDVGTAPLPVPDGTDPQGVIVGGASLWITNKVSEKKQDAAWEFIKYLTQSKVQAKWAAGTGYFPISPEAYNEPELKKIYDKYPQYKVAVKQLEDTKSTPATQGALTTIMPESRKIIESALEKMYQGTDPKKALDEAAKQIDQALSKKES